MKLYVAMFALFGIGLAAYLIDRVGLSAVASAMLAVGWGGFAILSGYALGLFVLLGAAWYVLVAGPPPVRLTVFIWGRLVRESAAELLPFSQVGGLFLGARAAILNGIAPPIAVASTIVDVTVEMLAQLVYVALGIGFLYVYSAGTPSGTRLADILGFGLVLAFAAGLSFFVLQRRAFRLCEGFVARWFPSATVHTAATAMAVDAIHAAHLRIGISFALHFAGWIASAAGTWIAFFLIGSPVDLRAVLAIESLVCAIRSAAFVVPNGLGVQEAAYTLLAPLFGVGPEFGIAVSFLKRARDIVIGIPVLLVWQAMEGHRLLIPENHAE